MEIIVQLQLPALPGIEQRIKQARPSSKRLTSFQATYMTSYTTIVPEHPFHHCKEMYTSVSFYYLRLCSPAWLLHTTAYQTGEWMEILNFGCMLETQRDILVPWVGHDLQREYWLLHNTTYFEIKLIPLNSSAGRSKMSDFYTLEITVHFYWPYWKLRESHNGSTG